MKRSSFITWEQIRVALLFVVSVVVIAIAVYQLGKAANLFSTRYDLVAFLSNANGLREGGPVTVAGQLAGTIKSIEFLPVDSDTARNLKLIVAIDEGMKEQVRRDSRAKVKTLGLLGDKVIDISPGTPATPILAEHDTLVVQPSLDYESVLAKGAEAVDDVVQLAADFRLLTGNLLKGQGTIGQMLTNRSLYDQLNGTLVRTNAMLQRVQSSQGSLARLLDDPLLYDRAVSTIASVDSVVLAFRDKNSSVGRLLADTTLAPNLSMAVGNLVRMSATADSIVKMIASGKGNAGRFLKDEQFFDNLLKLSIDVNALISDIRKDPQRYMKGLVQFKIF
jgi:phospholipid/cholesterol/gamma-HCH transport system substrate-binding protein